LPRSLAAWVVLMRRAQQPERLKPAWALTVAATLLHGLGFCPNGPQALITYLINNPVDSFLITP